MSQPFGKSSLEVTQQTVKFFETLLHASTDGIVITGASQNVVVANDAFCTFFGRQQREMVETSLPIWLAQLDPGAPQRWAELEQRVRREMECRDAEFRITMKGEVRHLSVNASLLQRVSGAEGGVIVSTWRDVTERRWAEEALRMKDSALAASIDAIAITDRHANLTYVNRSFLDMWGYDHQHEVLGKPATTLWQADEGAAQMAEALRANRGWTGELRARRKDGSLFCVQVSASAVSNDAGELTYMLASFVDISQRKQAEEALCSSEERYRKLFEEARDGVLLADAESGVIIDANQAAAELFGREKSELIGQHQRILHPPHELSEGFSETFRRHVGGSEGQVLEAQIVTRTGEVKDVAIKANLLQIGERQLLLGAFRDITKRKRADEAAREREERLRVILSSVQAGVLVVDAEDHTIVEANTAALRMIGASKEEVVGRICHKYVCPAEKGSCPITDLGKEVDNSECVLLTVAGRAMPIFKSVGAITLGGRPHLLESFLDISDRKQAEEERERLLHDMGERIKELRCMYRVAESVRKRTTLEEVLRDVVTLTPSAYQYPEITRARIRFDGKEYVSEAFAETEWRQSSDVVVAGEPRGVVEVFYLEARPELDEGPFLKEERELIDGLAQTLSEVIERNQAEQALQESEERHRVITEGAQDAIIVSDATGAIRFWNPAAETIFGYSAAEIVGRNLIDTIVPPQHRQAMHEGLAEFAKTGQGTVIGKTLELTALRKDATEFPIEISVSVYEDSEGFQAVAVVRDATERKDAEQRLRESNTVMSRALEREKRISASLEATMEQLERAQQATEAATRSKSEFLANMSHEIRTPMTSILGFADMLLEQGDLDYIPPERIQAAEAIKRNGEYLLGLINNILDLSKIETGKMTVEHRGCSVCDIVAEVAALARVGAEAKGLTFDLEYAGAVPETIQTDPTRLRQILINLLSNAIKFTEAGSVRLVTRFIGEGPQPLVQFDVVDTGIGMTQEQAAGVFRPFIPADASTTQSCSGTGLGLPVSQQLAELLGGEITVAETTKGVGTRMRIQVPTGPLGGVKTIKDPMGLTVAAPTAGGDAALADEQSLGGCQILLVEDGLDNQRLVVHMLNRAGAQVTVVENGSLAVDAALAASNDAKPFDLILMDMQMPVMDGYGAAGLLRRKECATPIVALTAHAMSGDREKCIQAGCSDYVTKPIDRNELIQTIRKHLQATVVS